MIVHSRRTCDLPLRRGLSCSWLASAGHRNRVDMVRNRSRMAQGPVIWRRVREVIPGSRRSRLGRFSTRNPAGSPVREAGRQSPRPVCIRALKTGAAYTVRSGALRRADAHHGPNTRNPSQRKRRIRGHNLRSRAHPPSRDRRIQDEILRSMCRTAPGGIVITLCVPRLVRVIWASSTAVISTCLVRQIRVPDQNPEHEPRLECPIMRYRDV